MTYDSFYQIDDKVSIANGNPGIIVAVRFTKIKVFYDVLDVYNGTVLRDIPSEYVNNED